MRRLNLGILCLWGILLLGLCGLAACDDDSWKEEIALIKSELEEQKKLLTELQNRATVVGIKEQEGCHIIEFSDGQTITVKDGYTPILSIGEDGNWYIDGESTGLQAVPEDGVTPTIEVGENGNWWINGQDIGVKAQGQDGVTPTIEIGDNDHWIVNGEDTGIPAYGKDGVTPTVEISEQGTWVINGEDTGKAVQGSDGKDAPTIVNIVDAGYKMDFTFSDGTVISVNKSFEKPHIRNAELPFMPDSLKILGIGNSFTIDGMTYLPQITYQNGLRNVVYATLEYGGASLQQHWDFYQNDETKYGFRTSNPSTGYWNKWEETYKTLREALQYENWDVIVLQQASEYSGLYHTYQPYLNDLLDELALMAGNARVVFAWQMTWAYGSNSDHPGFAYYDHDQKLMQQKIEESVRMMAQESGVDLIIPSGAIIQDLRASEYNRPPADLTRDGTHLDLGIGCYAASAAWFETLVAPVFRTTVVGNTFETYYGIPVNGENREFVQRSVKSQCRKWSNEMAK